MPFRSPFVRTLTLSLALALLAACTPAKDQAGQLMSRIDAALATAGPEAQKYAPDDFNAVLKQVQELRSQMTSQDYSAVVKAAPAILDEIKALPPKVAAGKAEMMKRLEEQWAQLAVSVPADIDAVEAQARQIVAAGKAPAGAAPDALATAKTGLDAYRAFWQQAVEAQAAGDLEKAVQIGNSIKRRMLALSVAFGGSAS